MHSKRVGKMCVVSSVFIRSKAGFLVAGVEKCKRGELDVRGFGAADLFGEPLKRVHIFSTRFECRFQAARARQLLKYHSRIEPEADFINRMGGEEVTISVYVMIPCAKGEKLHSKRVEKM